jgi:Subtilisin inhibitor-like
MGRTCKGTVSNVCLVALIGCCLALITGCGGLGGSSDSDSGSGSDTGSGSTAGTELTITVQPQGSGGPTRTWTLSCDPPGGTLPGAQAACTRLSPAVLRPLPQDTICTQIYGGPQTARVRGRVDGRPVDTRFSRTNGCEIHRWDSARFLLPVKI